MFAHPNVGLDHVLLHVVNQFGMRAGLFDFFTSVAMLIRSKAGQLICFLVTHPVFAGEALLFSLLPGEVGLDFGDGEDSVGMFPESGSQFVVSPIKM